MKTETTHIKEYNANQENLYMAFELGEAEWKLGFTIRFAQKPRLRTIKARDLAALEKEIRMAKQRFRLPEEGPIMSCYEAGREGFWIHRYLEKQEIHNLVVDSSSIEVNRKHGGRKQTSRIRKSC